MSAQTQAKQEIPHHGGFANLDEFETFLIGGAATFTVTSKATGKRFTYKVSKLKDLPLKDYTGPYFVSVLNGPDNWANYQFIGTMWIKDQEFKFTAGNKGKPDAPSFKGFAWLIHKVVDPRNDKLFEEQCDVHHEGKCCRCGRKLTVPSSVEAGIGPECASKGV